MIQMSRVTPRFEVPLARMLAFAVVGGLIALGLGLAAVALAPDSGFGDLAAATVTRLVLIPAGIIGGAVAGWLTGRE